MKYDFSAGPPANTSSEGCWQPKYDKLYDLMPNSEMLISLPIILEFYQSLNYVRVLQNCNFYTQSIFPDSLFDQAHHKLTLSQESH